MLGAAPPETELLDFADELERATTCALDEDLTELLERSTETLEELFTETFPTCSATVYSFPSIVSLSLVLPS